MQLKNAACYACGTWPTFPSARPPRLNLLPMIRNADTGRIRVRIRVILIILKTFVRRRSVGLILKPKKNTEDSDSRGGVCHWKFPAGACTI